MCRVAAMILGAGGGEQGYWVAQRGCFGMNVSHDESFSESDSRTLSSVSDSIDISDVVVSSIFSFNTVIQT